MRDAVTQSLMKMFYAKNMTTMTYLSTHAHAKEAWRRKEGRKEGGKVSYHRDTRMICTILLHCTLVSRILVKTVKYGKN